MALTYYKNSKPYSMEIPGLASTFEIYPGEYVASYFYYDGLVQLGVLTNAGTTLPTDNRVIYYYPDGPGVGGSPTPSGVSSIIAGSGIAVNAATGDVTVSVASGGITAGMIADGSLTANKFASGQIVKSWNGLFDNITLAAGTNISLSTIGQVVTLSAPVIGFTVLNATAPLVLTSSGGGSTINGSVAITPANSGGAVALQTGSPVTQTGFASLDNLLLDGFLAFDHTTNTVTGGDDPAYIFAKNIASDSYLYRYVDNADANLAYVDKTGLNYAKNFQGLTAALTTSLTVGSAVTLNTTAPHFDVDTTFNKNLILGQASANTGKIVGSSNANASLIDLVSLSNSVPALKFTQDAGHLSALDLALYASDNTTLLAYLLADGTFKAKTVLADNFALNAKLLTVGSYDLSTVEGNYFACDTSGGAITIQLPLVTSTSKNLTYIFNKVSNSSNNVLVTTTTSQTIDGVTTKLISTAFSPLRVVAVVGTELPTPSTQYFTF